LELRIDLESKRPSFGRLMDNWNLQFKWNAHGQFWYMSIVSSGGKQLASGIKLVLGRNLLLGFKSEGSPTGLMALVPKADVIEPTYDNLDSYEIYYNDSIV